MFRPHRQTRTRGLQDDQGHTDEVGIALRGGRTAGIAAGCGDDDNGDDHRPRGADRDAGHQRRRRRAGRGAGAERLKSKGTLTVAADATYAPNEFIAEDGHTVIGMDPDLAKAIAQVMGLEAEVKNATFDSIIPRPRSQQVRPRDVLVHRSPRSGRRRSTSSATRSPAPRSTSRPTADRTSLARGPLRREGRRRDAGPPRRRRDRAGQEVQVGRRSGVTSRSSRTKTPPTWRSRAAAPTS